MQGGVLVLSLQPFSLTTSLLLLHAVAAQIIPFDVTVDLSVWLTNAYAAKAQALSISGKARSSGYEVK